MNIRKGLAYVEAHGDDMDRARAAALVNDTRPSPEIIARLEALQGSGGGWPTGLESGRPESVAATCETLAALQDLGLQTHPMAGRALDFLVAQQEEDGSWVETGEEGRPQPHWLSQGEEAARIYLAAWASSFLVAYGRGREPAAERAVDLLLRHQLEGGLFPGFPRHTAWYALPVLALNLGQRSGPAQNILHTLTLELAAGNWFPSMFAALLRNLLIAGYAMETQLVRVVWEQLLMRQREDGAWASEEGSGGNVRSTLDVLWCWRHLVPR